MKKHIILSILLLNTCLFVFAQKNDKQKETEDAIRQCKQCDYTRRRRRNSLFFTHFLCSSRRIPYRVAKLRYSCDEKLRGKLFGNQQCTETQRK